MKSDQLDKFGASGFISVNPIIIIQSQQMGCCSSKQLIKAQQEKPTTIENKSTSALQQFVQEENDRRKAENTQKQTVDLKGPRQLSWSATSQSHSQKKQGGKRGQDASKKSKRRRRPLRANQLYADVIASSKGTSSIPSGSNSVSNQERPIELDAIKLYQGDKKDNSVMSSDKNSSHSDVEEEHGSSNIDAEDASALSAMSRPEGPLSRNASNSNYSAAERSSNEEVDSSQEGSLSGTSNTRKSRTNSNNGRKSAAKQDRQRIQHMHGVLNERSNSTSAFRQQKQSRRVDKNPEKAKKRNFSENMDQPHQQLETSHPVDNEGYFKVNQQEYYDKVYSKMFVKERQKEIKSYKCKPHPDGFGSFGDVFQAQTSDGRVIAVKRVKLGMKNTEQEDNKRIKNLEIEIKTLQPLNHPNIVKYCGFRRNETERHFDLLLEWCDDDLNKVSKKFNLGAGDKEGLVATYTKQIIQGLEYLHAHKFLHRDIKPHNVLLDDKGICKLADFGCAKAIKEKNQHYTRDTGTMIYMAPEVIIKNQYNYFADIWSLGVTVFQMATNTFPWSELNKHPHETYFWLGTSFKNNGVDYVLPKLPRGTSPELKDFLYSCLQIQPKKRANVYELYRHPFIQKLRLSEKARLLQGLPDSLETSPVGQREKPALPNIEVVMAGYEKAISQKSNVTGHTDNSAASVSDTNDAKQILRKRRENLEQMSKHKRQSGESSKQSTTRKIDLFKAKMQGQKINMMEPNTPSPLGSNGNQGEKLTPNAINENIKRSSIKSGKLNALMSLPPIEESDREFADVTMQLQVARTRSSNRTPQQQGTFSSSLVENKIRRNQKTIQQQTNDGRTNVFSFNPDEVAKRKISSSHSSAADQQNVPLSGYYNQKIRKIKELAGVAAGETAELMDILGDGTQSDSSGADSGSPKISEAEFAALNHGDRALI